MKSISKSSSALSFIQIVFLISAASYCSIAQADLSDPISDLPEGTEFHLLRPHHLPATEKKLYVIKDRPVKAETNGDDLLSCYFVVRYFSDANQLIQAGVLKSTHDDSFRSVFSTDAETTILLDGNTISSLKCFITMKPSRESSIVYYYSLSEKNVTVGQFIAWTQDEFTVIPSQDIVVKP